MNVMTGSRPITDDDIKMADKLIIEGLSMLEGGGVGRVKR